MRTLVIDTAASACSVALLEDGAIVDGRHEVIGRGHAERLVPMVAELADGGRADAILVDCGPGSFTGVRVGLAAARALAIGWSVPVSGYSATSIVAAHHAAFVDGAIAVVLEGGHGEVFMQGYAANPLVATTALASLTPAEAIASLDGRIAVGNGVRHLLALAPAIQAHEALPDARHARLLPPELSALAPRPIYGREPDAKPMP